MRAAANEITKYLNFKTRKINDKKERNWRKRIIEKQKMIHKDLGQIDWWRRNELQNEFAKEKLERVYSVKERNRHSVWRRLERLVVIVAKLERYDNHKRQFKQKLIAWIKLEEKSPGPDGK